MLILQAVAILRANLDLEIKLFREKTVWFFYNVLREWKHFAYLLPGELQFVSVVSSSDP